MPLIAYIIGAVLFLFPLIIFFDYNKPGNVYMAVIYVLSFIPVAFFLKWVTATYTRGLVFAMAVPFLMMILLYIAKKRKHKVHKLKKQNDKRIIDDL